MSAALEGIGAAILWTAQGAFVTNSVTEYEEQNKLPSGTAQGTFNGLFFALFSVNQFIGNLLVAVLFQFQVSERLTFIVSTAICACGSVSMLFLRTPEAAVSTDVDAKEKPEKSLWSNISMLVDPTFILLVPVIIYNGLSQGYIFGALPDLVSQCSSKFYVMSVFGAVDAIASYSIGRISDRVGKRPFLFIGTVVHSFTYLAIFFKLFDSDSFYFVCAVLLGIGDAVWQTQAYAIVGTFFENNATAAFANFKLFQAGSTAVSFFLYKVISKSYQAIICVSMLGLGILALTVLNFKYRSIDLKRRVTFSKSDMDE
jgi:MFS family permease